MNDKQFEELDKKIDKIVALLTIQNISGKDDKIYTLKKLGYTSDEISPLVNIKNVRDTKGWKRK